ncbi:MAG: transpeptidase family protein [Flavobacteriales bacterium]|nr:transpeptidase family protein [Flavobacteriales bacterium]MCB9449363.1 transpeptidase family protein [Flavobacteriales bacterium]
MAKAKNNTLWRIYLVYFCISLFAILIFAQVVRIQTTERSHWLQLAEEQTMRYVDIDAARGNIFAQDGSLLATSIPIYEMRMDPSRDVIPDSVFNTRIDSLGLCLSRLFKDKSPKQYVAHIRNGRKHGNRYLLIQRNVRYTELKTAKEFPIFRLGRFKGGLIFTQKNRRIKPFQLLASRTIGYDREGIQSVGLEAAYRDYLKGVGGKRLMQRISGNLMMPVNDKNFIEPQDGYDIVTTLDVNLQDVAEHALLYQLEKHNAHHGSVVLMEVKTGRIKAIANLTRRTDDTYDEVYNYAIGESTEPGSTFKLASLMAGYEDGLISPEDSVDTKKGKTRFYDRIMNDAHEGGFGKITAQRAFEVSSNVGVSLLINNAYGQHPEKFVERLHTMGLGTKLGLDIPGEGKPYLKERKDPSWSGITLPWMSIGYETTMTPLQILTFYNAVANNGKMVKPQFVEEVKERGKTIRKFKTEVLNPSICSAKTIANARKMMEGVVDSGTAINLRNSIYPIAGKTGTAQIANAKYGYKGSGLSYQASFVGYFPADDPAYSCIVVVNAPSNNVYYGNLVAGPIFKEIADKVYAGSLNMHEAINLADAAHAPLPRTKVGLQKETTTVLNALQIPVKNESDTSEWVIIDRSDSTFTIQNKRIGNELKNGFVPNLSGMGASDALYILENYGLLVELNGAGRVIAQSIPPGTRFKWGQTIQLDLAT